MCVNKLYLVQGSRSFYCVCKIPHLPSMGRWDAKPEDPDEDRSPFRQYGDEDAYPTADHIPIILLLRVKRNHNVNFAKTKDVQNQLIGILTKFEESPIVLQLQQSEHPSELFLEALKMAASFSFVRIEM